jgi:tetratricopeptide (TPR) repeat protein
MHARTRVPRTPRPARALAALLLLGVTGCMGPMGGSEAETEKDVVATKEHYEESAQTYYEGGRYQQSVMMWRKVLELEPERQKAKWGLAKSLSMIGTPPALREAESIFAAIVDLDWSHPTLGDRRHEVVKDYAEVYSQLADYYDKDVRSLKKELEAPGADTARIRQQIGQQEARRNELLQKAIPLYQQVLSSSPDNPYAIGGLAKSYLQLRQDAQGIQYARRYIDLAVRSQGGWETQLKDYEQTKGADLTEEQRRYFTDNIESARGKEMRIRLLLGAVLFRNRDYRGALQEYDRVLQIDPKQVAALVERAQTKAALGEYRGAMADLETYLKVTDPVELRQSRIDAAQLLDQYRLKAAAQPRVPPGGAPPPVAPPGGLPPPPPPPRPAPGTYPAPPPPPTPAPAPRR